MVRLPPLRATPVLWYGEIVRTIRTIFAAYPGVQGLDIVGPWEALRRANDVNTGVKFELCIASPRGGPVTTSTGLRLDATCPWGSPGECDLVIVPGGAGVYDMIEHDGQLRELLPALESATMIASVCTGAFILAQLGLLEGRRAVTHWQAAEKFRARFPAVNLVDDQVFCHDVVWTSAGVTAGMDMALALVEHLCGGAVAFDVSKWMVLPFRRAAKDKQISGILSSQEFASDTISEILTFIENNPQSRLDLESLAQRSKMSQRNFSRVFQRRLGVSPGRYVQERRLNHAKRLLHETDWGLGEIADKCGIGSASSLRRLLARCE